MKGRDTETQSQCVGSTFMKLLADEEEEEKEEGWRLCRNSTASFVECAALHTQEKL